MIRMIRNPSSGDTQGQRPSPREKKDPDTPQTDPGETAYTQQGVTTLRRLLLMTTRVQNPRRRSAKKTPSCESLVSIQSFLYCCSTARLQDIRRHVCQKRERAPSSRENAHCHGCRAECVALKPTSSIVLQFGVGQGQLREKCCLSRGEKVLSPDIPGTRYQVRGIFFAGLLLYDTHTKSKM